MTVEEVIRISLGQLGDLRIPAREEELATGIRAVMGNLEAVLEAIKANDAPEAGEEATQDV